MSMVGARTLAYDAYINGIYYNLSGEEAIVTNAGPNSANAYSGEINIPPSFVYQNNIYTVSGIGNDAFFGCGGITTVTIPNTVTNIGYSAFSGCSSLANIIIPNSVISIGGYAFESTPWYTNQQDGLLYIGKVAYKYKGMMPTGTSIEIEEGTIKIGCNAFNGCRGLTSIDIPSSVTSIDSYAFQDCSSLTSIDIPSSVTSIGGGAFWGCNSLTSIDIPSSVTSIGEKAFNYCSSLTSVTVEEGNPNYDSRNNCNAIIEKSSNQLILGCKNTIIPNSVTSIGGSGFSGITNIMIPNSVTSIGEEAFSGCSGLTSIDIPSSVTSIGDIAFYNCSGLTSIDIPSGVTSIGDYAFYGCSSLTSIGIPNSVTSIGEDAFYGCSSLTTITLPNSVTSIGHGVFGDCSGLTSIEIPSSVTSIGGWAFSGCSGLTTITLPNSVTSIGNYAFDYCSSLTSIEIPNSVTSIGNEAFYRCSSLTSIEIPSSVTSIGGSAFSGCSGLTSIDIPSSVTSIGNSAFSGCSGLTSITVEEGNSNYDSRNNCNAIIEKSSNILILGCKNTIIPSSVTSIGYGAFYGCSGLTSIDIPSSVSSIGVDAFENCSGLTSIDIPSSVSSIGVGAFYGCSGLTSIDIPSSVTSIGEAAFNLTPWYENQQDGLLYIGKVAYKYKGTMPNGTNIKIEEGTIEIGNYAFYGCSGLTSISFSSSVTSIGRSAFEGCSGLTSIDIPSSVSSIDYSAFQRCSNLTEVKVGMIVPLTIEYSFINRENATLYVPHGSKAAYDAADYWNEFREIVEVIEVDDVATQDDALYIEPMDGRKGGMANIKVKLKNAASVTSYGLELTLPEGMSITTDNSGAFESQVTMSVRHDGHTMTTNKLSDNVYKIGVTSLSSKSLTGSDGIVLTIKANVDEDMEEGIYPIILRDPLIVYTNGTKPDVVDMYSQVTINDYQNGDVDGDGVIDLADAVLVINRYVGRPITNFNEKAADVDGDGVIDLADAVLIINYYVGRIPSLSREIEETELEPQ